MSQPSLRAPPPASKTLPSQSLPALFLLASLPATHTRTTPSPSPPSPAQPAISIFAARAAPSQNSAPPPPDSAPSQKAHPFFHRPYRASIPGANDLRSRAATSEIQTRFPAS